MKTLFVTLQRLYERFFEAVDFLQSPFLLVVRLYWGWQLAANGWAKLHNLSRVIDYFSSLNVPHPGFTAPFVSSTELVCGILLALGLLSRFASLVLTIDMANAYFFGDRPALLSFFSDPDKFTAATPYTTLCAVLVILIFGPGLFCLDALLKRVLGPPEVKELRLTG
jgi:putative oxidoreductase